MAYKDPEKARLWRDANRERMAALQKAWRNANKEHIAAYDKMYKRNNPEKAAVSKAAYKARCRTDLRDAYIKTCLCQSSTLKPRDIPKSFVEAKRIQMQINREINNAKRNGTA
jgi:hypothetical protein